MVPEGIKMVPEGIEMVPEGTRDEPTRDEPTCDEPTRDGPTRDEPTRDGPTREGIMCRHVPVMCFCPNLESVFFFVCPHDVLLPTRSGAPPYIYIYIY